MKSNKLFLILLFLLTIGLNSIVHSQSRVFFLQMNMTFDPVTKDNKITLVKRTSLSRSQRQNLKDEFVSENHLQVEFFENNTLSRTFTIPHPLIRTFEVFDGGSFSRVESTLQSNVFFIRVPVRFARNRLIIYEKLSNLPRVEKIQITL